MFLHNFILIIRSIRQQKTSTHQLSCNLVKWDGVFRSWRYEQECREETGSGDAPRSYWFLPAGGISLYRAEYRVDMKITDIRELLHLLNKGPCNKGSIINMVSKVDLLQTTLLYPLFWQVLIISANKWIRRSQLHNLRILRFKLIRKSSLLQ